MTAIDEPAALPLLDPIIVSTRQGWADVFETRLTHHYVTVLGDDYDAEGSDRLEVPIDEANVASSLLPGTDVLLTDDRQHRPVLDIDLPAWLLPSSTPGHFHLVIDKPMSWVDYQRLLAVLVDVGIVQPGYVGASVSRGYTSMRLPWIRKPEPATFGDAS